MSDTKKPQNEPTTAAEAARRSGAASTAQAAGDALRRGGEAGAEMVRRTEGLAAEAVQRGTQQVAEAQQRLVEDTAHQFQETGQRLAQAVQQTAEDLRSLLPRPDSAAEGLRELQQALAGLVEGATRTNLRLAQELVRLANPGVVLELQQRFAREYLGTLAEGQAGLLRATRHSAEQALRPLERQLEQRRRGRPQAGPGDRPRPASRVAEVMSREVRLASPEDTVQQATRLMREADTGVLPVGEADRLVGMLTDRDVALRLVADGKDPARTKVREVMTAEVRYVFEDEDLHRAAESMAAQQVRRLPVVTRSQRLVGMVSLGDLAAAGRTPRLAGRALAGIAQEGGRHDQTAAE